MSAHRALVITSINSSDNPVLQAYAKASVEHDVNFIIAGDYKSPANFILPGAQYLSLNAQLSSEYDLARLLPHSHYCRKNIGYLYAIRQGASIIIETDDDNYPLGNFWDDTGERVKGQIASGGRWFNAFEYFGGKNIWPRGFALRLPATDSSPTLKPVADIQAPVRQFLANGNPDIDAIQRLQADVRVNFENKDPLILDQHLYCPFNTQNTTWFREAYALLYIPATCSFRMCDIWRSFITQRILHACNWHLSFHAPTVFQDRNEHDLMNDLRQEVEGYLYNEVIVEMLELLPLPAGPKNIPRNLKTCYEAMVSAGLLDPTELIYLDCWLKDLEKAVATTRG